MNHELIYEHRHENLHCICVQAKVSKEMGFFEFLILTDALMEAAKEVCDNINSGVIVRVYSDRHELRRDRFEVHFRKKTDAMRFKLGVK